MNKMTKDQFLHSRLPSNQVNLPRFQDMSLKELKEICRSEPGVYRGFSKLKKDDLIDFMYRKNSSVIQARKMNYRAHIPIPSYSLSDVAHIFETPEESEERIQSYHEPKPEDSIIEDLICDLQRKYPRSSVIFDKHSDENNDLIYRGNKGKYISQHGSLGEHGEKILYHGTDGQNLISILGDDFRITNNPVHGHVYGKGIYFTDDIEKAIYYSERGKSTKYIIVCNVHIGDICLGNAAMDIHPKMPGRDKSFDTSVDHLQSPRQFIKKKNGTYNILGIITIENYIEKSHMTNRFSASFQILNEMKFRIKLYWVPDNIVHMLPNVDINQCKRMSDIPRKERDCPGTTRMRCQIGHTFICVCHFNDNSKSASPVIIKIFTSKKRNETITLSMK